MRSREHMAEGYASAAEPRHQFRQRFHVVNVPLIDDDQERKRQVVLNARGGPAHYPSIGSLPPHAVVLRLRCRIKAEENMLQRASSSAQERQQSIKVPAVCDYSIVIPQRCSPLEHLFELGIERDLAPGICDLRCTPGAR